MHFSNQNSIHAEPDLELYGAPIPETKFLGLVFDRKLTLSAHIQYLKDRCLKAQNLLRVEAHKDWGADSATLLKLYRTHVRSKLDFGCVVYGSARLSALESLDRVKNAALRICIGAFRTSPIPSLYVDAGELPLNVRRQQLSLQYVDKLRSNPSNPAFHCFFNSGFSRLFETRPSVSATLGHRLQESLLESGIILSNIAKYSTPQFPPWVLKKHPSISSRSRYYTQNNIVLKSSTCAAPVSVPRRIAPSSVTPAPSSADCHTTP